MSKFYIYVLQSQSDQKLYVGLTDNVHERLRRHNEGRVSSTKTRTPFLLVYHETFIDRNAARRREKFLKSGNGRAVLKKILARVVEPANGRGG